MAARASLRVSIAWSGAEPIEDTDTLVLTIDGYSLDLRVFTSGPQEGEIDWSTVAHVGEIEGSTKENPKLRWDHIIDSRPPTSMPDQGTFDTLPNGDVTETGVMYNPKTSAYEAYVETWRRYKLPAAAPYVVLHRSSRVDGEDGLAFVGRVGEMALGLAKTQQGEYLAWRDQLVDGAWKRLYLFGDKEKVDRWLPALPVQTPQHWAKEAGVDFGEGTWTVTAVGTV